MTLWSPGTARSSTRSTPSCTNTDRVPRSCELTSPTRRSAPLGVAVGEHRAAGGARRLGEAPRPVVVVAGDDEPAVGDGLDEGGVGLLDRLAGAVEVEVVGLHVGDDGDVGAVGEERAVALVGLDDEGRAATEGGVGAELRDLATGGERGVGPGGDQRDDEHRRGGGLAVGAGDRDPARAAHQRGERLGPVQHPQARGAGGGELDVVVADRRRHHDGVDVGDVRRVVAEVDAGTAVAQRLQHGAVGGVGAADRQAAREQQPGDGRHAGPADGDEVHAAEQLEAAPRAR